MLIALSVILIGLLVFSIAFRKRITSILRGAGFYFVGTWNNIWGAMRGPALTAIILCGISWALMIVLMIGLGVYANSSLSAILISILFPLWFVAFIMPPALNIFWLIGPILRLIRGICGPIILLATIFLLFGLWSPMVKHSLDRWSDNKKGEIANSLDKSSMKTEPEMGKFAKVLEESQIYNSTGQPVFSVQKGTTVLVKDLNGKKTSAEAEGMTRVMLPNRHGDFVNGNEGLISTRKLDWDWQAYDAKAKAEAEAKAKIEKAEAEAKAKAQAEAKALELRRQAEKIEAEKNKITTITNGYVLRPANGGVVCLTMQPGYWNVFPADTRLKEVGDAMPRITGDGIFVPREKTSCFFPSPGTKEIVLTKK